MHLTSVIIGSQLVAQSYGLSGDTHNKIVSNLTIWVLLMIPRPELGFPNKGDRVALVGNYKLKEPNDPSKMTRVAFCGRYAEFPLKL